MLQLIALLICSLVLQVASQEVRLVDGLNSCQGRLEILLPTANNFGQACDLDAGANEVQVVCRQLGCNPVGARRVDPITYGFSTAINSYSAFGFTCNGGENSLSACSEPGAVCRTDDANFAIAIECGDETSPNVRLVGGIGSCQGRVEHRPSAADSFGQSCDLDVGDQEAQVVCRERGCDPAGARRVNPTNYGFSPAINAYRAFGFSCNGNENTLSDCTETGAVCRVDDVDHAFAVECGGSGPQLILIGGENSCQGLLIQRPLAISSERFGLSCDLDAGDNEARVICRHIGCNPNGARRAADPTVFGFSAAINSYRGFGYTCSGSENFISDCFASPFTCITDDADHAIAIECGV